MSEPVSTPEAEKSPQSRSSRRSWFIIPVVGGITLLMIAVVLVLFLGLRQVFFKDETTEDETSPGMHVEVIKPTPTVSASPSPLPSCETIISSDDVQVAVSLPISITVGSKPFPVKAVMSEQEGWTYPSGSSGSAVWICGTVVNYVVGLEPNPENEALLAGLRPGDEVRLLLSSGVELLFRFAEQREVAANEASVFEQVQPRLTLILETANNAWQIATADYVAETESVQPPSGTLAQPGQPVRIGDIQITLIRGHAEHSGDLLPGTMYYLVEFTIENLGTAPVDASIFNMQLLDSLGNAYLLSPVASAAGEYGPLGGEIAPGATVEGTAGYLVPETLAGPTLIWTFIPQPGSELRASVSISYEGETGPAPAGLAEVTITDVFLDADGSMVIIEGEVRNVGDGLLTVELGNISLTSSAGMSDLRMAAPPLPWVIEPGQTQVVELQYEKPSASTALLTLLGYSFEIGGLQ